MSGLVRAGYERKFRVPESIGPELLGTIRTLLAPDEHAGPEGSYRVSSLYLDTPDLAAARRETGGKWRLRRYGDDPLVYAEFKQKPEPGRVVKRRTAIAQEQLPQVLLGDGPAPWFAELAREHALAPTCLVEYVRHAFADTLEEEPVRVTIDHAIRALRTPCLALPDRLERAHDLMDGHLLLEVKFAYALPQPLERVLQRLDLQAESFSKYRHAIEKT